MNLDRFSRPLAGENYISPSSHKEALQELEDRQKKEMVRHFISSYHENTNKLPETWMISETFDHIYLDDSLINKELNNYREEL